VLPVIKSKFLTSVVVCSVAMLGTIALHGQSLSWNATTSFSLAANPNGAWSYGSKSAPTAPGLCLYTIHTCGWNHPTAGTCVSPTCWPYVNTGTATAIQVHPKTSATVGYSVVRWTAPFAATFQVSGQFAGQTSEPNLSCSVAVVSNGAVLPGLSGSVFATTAFPFNTTLLLGAGSTVEFVVGDGGNGDFQDHCLLSATITALCRLEFACPTGVGSVSVRNSGCTPSGVYATAITTNQGSYPNGPFFGVDITLAEVINSLSLGPPFFGSLDTNGGSLFTIPVGVPSGIMVYAVTVDVNIVLLVPISVSPPVTFTTC
jgi:hypothetical protein